MWVVGVVSGGGLLLLHSCRATDVLLFGGRLLLYRLPLLVACVVFDEWVLTRPVGLSFSNDDNFCDDRFALLGGGMTSTGRAPELPSWHQA